MRTPRLLVCRRSLLAGALAAGCARAPAPVASGPAAASASAAEAEAAAAAAAARPVITILGDSITAGYGLSAEDALPAQLQRALAARGVEAVVRSAGVSGDTTAGGLARVDFSVADDTALCIVALGGNDVLQGVAPEAIARNLAAILDKLEARGIPAMLAGMRAPTSYGDYAAELDRAFADLARERGVPFYPFLLEGVALEARYNQPDRIHPNAEGAKLIAERMAPLVAEALA